MYLNNLKDRLEENSVGFGIMDVTFFICIEVFDVNYI